MAHTRLCSIPGCDKPHMARGWCSRHWDRWRRHGDPLAGRTTEGEPQRYLLEVTLPYEGTECLRWPFSRNGAGYGAIVIDGKVKIVSRLVCEALHGPPPTPIHKAAHSCGHGHLACVTPRHLSWKTDIENEADKLVHNTRIRGMNQRTAKLTEADIAKIRAMKGTMLQYKIAEQFGVGADCISRILTGKTWGWLITPASSTS